VCDAFDSIREQLKNERMEAESQMSASVVRQSADHGDLHGQYYYASCLEQGRVVAPDLSLAARYYKQAMEQGGADADLGYDRCMNGLATSSKGTPDENEEHASMMQMFINASGNHDKRFRNGAID
jgi:TPR repeat protein